jgi:hypothetical protein
VTALKNDTSELQKLGCSTAGVLAGELVTDRSVNKSLEGEQQDITVYWSLILGTQQVIMINPNLKPYSMTNPWMADIVDTKAVTFCYTRVYRRLARCECV